MEALASSEVAPSQTRSRVLVVEDDEAIRVLVRTVLVRYGYQVETANDGVQAIECIRRNNYDAILMDFMMPFKTGLDVLEWMSESRPEVVKGCVIVFTAAAPRDLQEFDQESVFAVIRKPFDLQQLVLTVKSCVERWPGSARR